MRVPSPRVPPKGSALTLPADVRAYPEAIAQALSQLRLVGVNGPYSVLLGAEAYTALAETSDHGYPVLEHVKRLVKDEIIWAPAIEGAFVDENRVSKWVTILEIRDGKIAAERLYFYRLRT